MSAIWGIVAQDEIIDVKQKEEIMRKSYSHCVIDRTEYYANNEVALGCGIQYFTPEARMEILPVVNEEDEIYFTADVVLDNREELLKCLGISSDDKSISDGKILYEMFHKYKENCLNDILGAYSFVYIDQKKKEIYLVADSTGTRSLHYLKKGNEVYFSTLIEPIVQATGPKELNERWITEFLALDNMAMAVAYDETPYRDIYRVPAAHYIKMTSDKIETVCYWNPSVKNLKYKSDEEYKIKFKETFRDSVKRLIRNDNMTMLLSGGLDSTSVACFAAKETSATGRTLTSFTSVPEKDFKSNLSDYYVTDESEAVLKTQEFLAKKGYKIDCKFMDLAGRNSWDDRIDEVKVMEIPYKSMQNLLWIKEGMTRSYSMGARMMLTGGYGNITISNSFTSVYQYELIRKFHWITYVKDCIGYSKKFKTGKRQSAINMIQIFADSFKLKKRTDIKTVVGNSYIKKELLDKYHFEERAGQDYQKYDEAKYSGKKAKELIKNAKVFYQIGETQTKQSLATGVILRDPTMDKRLIELCMSYPISCYSQKGVTRRMVREYLSDEVPEHVINPIHYGLQSADTAKRLQKEGYRIFNELEKIFRKPEAEIYINRDKALEDLKKMQDFNAPNRNFELLRLEYTAMVIEYISDRIENGRLLCKGKL